MDIGAFIKRLGIFDYIIVVIVLATFSLAVYSPWRQAIQERTNSPFRKILSVLNADLLNNGTLMKVVKIQSLDGIAIEVYNLSDPGKQPLVDRIQITDQRDGFFTFRGEATNLAVDDVDGDSLLEILAPTYDQAHDSHLNVFKINPSSRKLETYQQN